MLLRHLQRSLRAKLVAIMVVASVSFGTSVLAFLQVLVADAIQNTTRENYLQYLQGLSAEIVNSALTENTFELQMQLFETVERDPRLVYLVVAGGEGRIVATSFGAQTPVALDAVLARAAAAEDLLILDRGRRLRHIAIDLLGGRAGRLHAAIDQERDFALARSITVRLLILFAFLTAIGIGVALFMGGVLTAPLRQLAEMAGRIGSGDLAVRIPPMTEDELGVLAEAFNEMTAKLSSSCQALVRSEQMAAAGQLAAGVAHEINNPLASVRACLWALGQPGLAPEQGASYLGALDVAIGRIARTVQRLLAFSRPNPPHFRAVSLAEVVRSAVTLFRPSLREEEIALELRIDGEPPPLRLDADQIGQVMVNLLLNACQAIRGASGNGRIAVALISGENAQDVVVEDDGPGIPVEARSKVFEPFYTTRATGTGLGLSVSRNIVAAHGGELLIEEPEGGRGGTVMRLRLYEDRAEKLALGDSDRAAAATLGPG
ncbi:MAG: HAMP domain-containing protein [Candidatus Schekmanbacteria bacterium]|nr:HAMP domain-containing protein [Candidatus Schekmanbacteria bacterium]